MSIKRTDVFCLVFLYGIIIVIFYPVLYTDYLYTDEAVQIWHYKDGINLTWITQGRYITYLVFQRVFSSISSVHALINARVFSLLGWMVCLPVWYGIIKTTIRENNLPVIIILPVCVYLVCMPPFAVYIGWSSCMELFIACTCGLISGYACYKAFFYVDKFKQGVLTILALICGFASLFTYQNGFGCFFIPFFIQFIALKKTTRNTWLAIGFSLVVYAMYYLLFGLSLKMNGMVPSIRTALAIDPIHKMYFFFTKPLASAFHFTRLFYEKNAIGKILYLLVFLCWLLVTLKRQQAKTALQKWGYIAGVVFFFVLIYLPSLLVSENYGSNRTLFALDLAAFLLVADTLFQKITDEQSKYLSAGILILLLVANAWYNFHSQFLDPVVAEYSMVRKFITQHYTSNIKAIYFIQPAENAFETKYGIVRSWDEFGTPSTAKPWTPEPLVKQVVFEMTGNRQLAEQLVVKSWMGNEAFSHSGKTDAPGVLVIDVEAILQKP